jgi:hypothetical protein
LRLSAGVWADNEIPYIFIPKLLEMRTPSPQGVSFLQLFAGHGV